MMKRTGDSTHLTLMLWPVGKETENPGNGGWVDCLIEQLVNQ